MRPCGRSRSTRSTAPARPSRRARTLAWLACRPGAHFVLPTVAAREQLERRMYDTQPGAGDDLRRDERACPPAGRASAETPGGVAGKALARVEGRHRSLGGNALRAPVPGANDRLVSNLSLVTGVAGTELSRGAILVTGVAVLLAGALSMAMGEWISVQSSRELYTYQSEVERLEIAAMPEVETQELALIYQAKGGPRVEAEALGRAPHERRGYGT